MASTPNLSVHIPELDGIRGAAIAMVLVWHYFAGTIEPASGSISYYALALSRLTWTGVDLFFVLSGYLIGGILLDAKDSANYFQVFYARRFFRIVPIYAAVLIVIPTIFFLVERASFQPDYLWFRAKALPWYCFWTLMQNFWMAGSNTLGSNLFGVTWSLAIEEQFYLTLPFAVRFFSRRGLLIFVFAGISLAPVLRATILLASPESWAAPFVLMPCRADGLLLGVLTAILLRRSETWNVLQAGRGYFVAGLLVLFAGMAFLTWRGGAPSSHGRRMPVFGYTWIEVYYTAVLVFVLAYRDSLMSRISRNKSLAWLGKLAYCIYLIHQPVIGFLFLILLNRPPRITEPYSLAIALLSLVVTLSVAKLSWKYFESPLVALGHKFRYGYSEQRSTLDSGQLFPRRAEHLRKPERLFAKPQVGKWDRPCERLVEKRTMLRIAIVKASGACPECRTKDVERATRRGLLERHVLPLLSLWPYRCCACDLKFFDFRRRVTR
jgi:peptidoglycan/LPS O-acetylase OafA/YrhL